MNHTQLLAGLCLLILIVAGVQPIAAVPSESASTPVATFSILGYDPDTGEIGGAVQSRVFSVGPGVLWAEADVGVVATQAIVDVSYGPKSLALLREGLKPEQVVRQVWDADPDPRPMDWSKQGRQFAVMNSKGEPAAFTGPKATPWAGHKTGKFCSAQGNILAGQQVVDDMIAAFEKSKGHLSLRLLEALEAGQAAGGDKRRMQSAAMVIVRKNGGVWLNNDTVLRLQVDDHAEPIKELRRLVEKSAGWRSRVPAVRTNPVDHAVVTPEQRIRQTLEKWPQSFNAKDKEATNGLFDKNYTAMCKHLAAALENPDRSIHYGAPSIQDILVFGDLSVVRLIWTLTVTDSKTGNKTEVKERGIDVLKRQKDGSWKVSISHAYPETGAN